jgi:hypothetical protein
MEIDLLRDPPPDLVIESEVSTSVVSKVNIYEALKIPELWRVSEQGIRVGLLQADGHYQWGDRSALLPTLPLAELVRFMRMKDTVDQLSILRAFRSWVRQHLGK